MDFEIYIETDEILNEEKENFSKLTKKKESQELLETMIESSDSGLNCDESQSEHMNLEKDVDDKEELIVEIVLDPETPNTKPKFKKSRSLRFKKTFKFIPSKFSELKGAYYFFKLMKFKRLKLQERMIKSTVGGNLYQFFQKFTYDIK